MMHRSFFQAGRLHWVAFSSLALLGARFAVAQVPPPPLPPPVGSEEPESSEETQPAEPPEAAPEESAPSEEAPAEEPPQQPPAVEAEASSTGAAEVALTTPAPLVADGSEAEDQAEAAKKWRRKFTSRRQTGINGSTGLHRVHEAGSGAPGTFRLNLLGSYFSKKGFLCHEDAPCTDQFGDDLGEDTARRTTASALLSITPLSFLEVYMGLFNSATTNTNGTPTGLLVVGDTLLGVKGYLPDKLDRIYSFGGEVEVGFLTGTGGVNVASAANVSLRALGTLDLNNRTDPSKRIPLRVHGNVGYTFENSWKIVEELEITPPPDGRGQRIERTERFGLGISRVDALEIGLGAEYVHDYVRPFLEYTIDIPNNRQKYTCNLQGAESRGDQCLGLASGFSTSPSRLSLGANVFPWQATGLSVTLAADIGIGGKKKFLEETTPEAPYSLWFGLGYVIDTVPPPPEVISVEAPVAAEPEVRRYVTGLVIGGEEKTPVEDALVRYEEVPMTGLVANAHGEFISQDLPPGQYTFQVTAENFEPGSCVVTIPESAPPLLAEATAEAPSSELGLTADPNAPVGPESQDETVVTEGAPAEEAELPQDPYLDGDGNLLVPLVCELKELPQVANITGLLVDSDTGGPVPGATVTITDTKNRSLSLAVDDVGSFQFRNVPFGDARLQATAPGYLPTVGPLRIDSRKEFTPHLIMNPRPNRLGVSKRRGEVVVERPLQFVGETTDLTIKSTAMLEELAVYLVENEDVAPVEIQVHTDDSGAASYSRRISQERADRLREHLIQLGVSEDRLTAKGYGPDQPLVPNVNDANRSKNNRVQFVIVKE